MGFLVIFSFGFEFSFFLLLICSEYSGFLFSSFLVLLFLFSFPFTVVISHRSRVNKKWYGDQLVTLTFEGKRKEKEKRTQTLTYLI